MEESSEIFAELYCKEIKRKVEQDTERGISASQGLVRRSFLGTKLFSWKCGTGVGGGTEYIETQDTHHAKSTATGLVH